MTNAVSLVRATSPAVACVAIVFASCNADFQFDIDPDAGALDASPETNVNGIACTTDATCAGIRCDVASGACVACLEDGDCSGSQPHCDAAMHVCVECLQRADCTGKHQTCDPTTRRCLSGCFDADDACPNGFSCNEDLELCAECKVTANCSASPHGTVCDSAIGQCVECTTNAGCPSERPVCDLRSGHCEVCIVSASCLATEICDPSTLTCRARS